MGDNFFTLLKTKIDGKFRIIKHQLGSGSFGTIHLGIKEDTDEMVAVKCEPSKQPIPSLNIEARILGSLQGKIGIPKLYYYGEIAGYNLMIFDLLGPSLEDMFNLCDRKLSLKTTLMLADQLISRIEFLHSKGYIHRDIKPENFLLGLGRSAHIIHLIDFGLGKKYRDQRNNQHIPYRENKSLVGTARYATINSHLGMEQSRRDDIESIGYLLVYFLKGNLPWQGIKAADKQDKYNKIMEKKLGICPEQLCRGLPTEFAIYLNYAKNLKYEDKPDYLYLRKMFKELFVRRNFVQDFMFDWCVPPDHIHPNEQDNSKYVISYTKEQKGNQGLKIMINTKQAVEEQEKNAIPEEQEQMIESDYNRNKEDEEKNIFDREADKQDIEDLEKNIDHNKANELQQPVGDQTKDGQQKEEELKKQEEQKQQQNGEQQKQEITQGNEEKQNGEKQQQVDKEKEQKIEQKQNNVPEQQQQDEKDVKSQKNQDSGSMVAQQENKNQGDVSLFD